MFKKYSILILLALILFAPGKALAAQQTPPYPVYFYVIGMISPGNTGVQDLEDFRVLFYKNSGDPSTAYTDAYTNANGSFAVNALDDLQMLPLVPAKYYLRVEAKQINGVNYGIAEQEIEVTDTDLTNGYKVLSATFNLITQEVLSTLKIATSLLPNGLVDEDYISTLEATGGLAPYTWGIVEGSLPPGLSLSASTGIIKGKPSLYGRYNIKVKVTDYDKPFQSDTKELLIDKVMHYEPAPDMKIWYGNRIYQEKLVAEGKIKTIVPAQPKVKVKVDIISPYSLSQAIGTDYPIILNPGTQNAETFNLSNANVSQKVMITGTSSIQAYSFSYQIPIELDGINVLKYSAKSGGSEFGIPTDISKFTTVEVMGGPIRVVGDLLVYPSPFSKPKDDELTIQYTLSGDADIEIYIIDVGGRRVKKFSFMSGAEGGSAGINKVVWDASTAFGGHLANGIYVGTVIAKQEGRLLGKLKLTVVN